MGGIWMPRRGFMEEFANLIGVRIGLAVPENRLIDKIRTLGYAELVEEPLHEVTRVRSEDVEALATDLLAAFGDVVAASGPFPISRAVVDLNRGGPPNEEVGRALLAEWVPNIQLIEHHGMLFWASVPGVLHLLISGLPMGNDALAFPEAAPKVLETIQHRFGDRGRKVAETLHQAMHDERRVSIFSRVVRFQDSERLPLDDLFSVTNVHAGTLLDQRHIDFLAANLDDLDRMHWRQFEILCATYFARLGFKVELGPGIGDDGVDLRLWPEDATSGRAPILIVQCKRQGRKVGKTVVKALWADVIHEGAGSGLIATTSTLEPGARRVLEARGYPIEVADGAAIRKWVVELRTPGTGVYLAS